MGGYAACGGEYVAGAWFSDIYSLYYSVVEGLVVGKVKGGLSVDIGVKAFLPASQIDIRPVSSLDNFIGKRFQFKILKLNKRKGNIILSRRVLLEKDRDQIRKETLRNIVEGQAMKGTVKNITDYGAFVDLGGVDGLLHIKDMSWGRLNHPSEICQVGDSIEVMILNVDQSTGKVSLGFKQLTADPWEGIEERYPIGSRLTAKVVNIMDYGAFLELEQGVEGLAHISEMTWTKKTQPAAKLVEVGQKVDVVVLDIDRSNRRISLGMKQLIEDPWPRIREEYQIGKKFEAKILGVTDRGLEIEVEPGVEGLIPRSALHEEEEEGAPIKQQYERGQTVATILHSIDERERRISFGLVEQEGGSAKE